MHGSVMKTSTIQVQYKLSVLSVDEVEKRIGEVPGVASVTVDFAAGRATVRYDETRLDNAAVSSPAEPVPSETDAKADTSEPHSHEQ